MEIDFSNPMVIGALVVAGLVILIVIVAFEQKRLKSVRLRKRFGSEFDRTALELGSERKAEAVLADRESRVQQLKLRELGAAQRERFAADWNIVQARFLDHPRGALTEADELITSLLQARGYPVSGFEQNVEGISVHYPGLIESYRSAHQVAVLSSRDQASIGELRSAMLQYRGLFDELILAEAPAVSRPVHTGAAPMGSGTQS